MATAKTNGFTIIEVLIVLAVAGLIMVVVFMAVPAMRRNFRNTSRTHDASYVSTQRLQYDTEIITSNNLMPGGYTCDNPPTPSEIFCSYLTKGLSYYDVSDINFHYNGQTLPSSVPTVTDPDTILTDTFLTCNSTNTAATTANAAWYDMVVLYTVETGNGPQPKCLHAQVSQSATS